MDPADLERVVHRRLRALPPLRAPETLLPRVLAAARDAARRRARAWFAWAPSWQAAAVVALVAAAAGLAIVWPTVELLLRETAAAAVDPLAAVLSGVTDRVRALATAARLIGGAVPQRALVVCAVLLVLMWTACAALGTALSRVVLGGTSRS
jgi:hypothetical protein